MAAPAASRRARPLSGNVLRKRLEPVRDRAFDREGRMSGYVVVGDRVMSTWWRRRGW